jgi:hypothetical protein
MIERAYWKLVDVKKALLDCLFMAVLFTQVIACFPSSPSDAESAHNEKMIAQSPAIVVNGTDCNSTFTFEYDPYLLNITEGVTSRIVVEYGEFVIYDELASVNLPPIDSRIIVEYAECTVTFGVSEWKPWDVNADGKVNIIDVSIVARHFGSIRDGLNWDGRCDLDLNGVINIVDVSIAARHFGEIGIDP